MNEKKTVLITGANGQLGQELIHIQHEQYSVIPLARELLDVTSLEQCRAAMLEYKPTVVIHCAAYTAVDKAESDKDSAFLVNEQGTKNITIASAEVDAKLVYISTDYVFDGKAEVPYQVDDSPNPQTVYGLSKLAGERAVKLHHNKYFIIRTSWVFGQYGQNFVKTMIKLAAERSSIEVVADQIGSPTYTYDLAQLIYQLMETEHYGVYHATNAGQCSWYELACEIFNILNIEIEINPCTTEQYPRPARRPHYSVLSNKKLCEIEIKSLRRWQEALKHMLNK